jgi:hypothetical protein
MTESFGSCEASFTSAQEAAISSLAQQAVEGITYTASAGDAGSAGCDSSRFPTFLKMFGTPTAPGPVAERAAFWPAEVERACPFSSLPAE